MELAGSAAVTFVVGPAFADDTTLPPVEVSAIGDAKKVQK